MATVLRAKRSQQVLDAVIDVVMIVMFMTMIRELVTLNVLVLIGMLIVAMPVRLRSRCAW